MKAKKLETEIANLLILIYMDFRKQPETLGSRRKEDKEIFDNLSKMGDCIQSLVCFEILQPSLINDIVVSYYLIYCKIFDNNILSIIEKNAIIEELNIRCSNYFTIAYDNELYETVANFQAFDKKLSTFLDE